MGARYTSVDLKDGRELLVPNEDLVTQRVINWSYSSDLMRLEVKFSATYDSDLHKTRAAAVDAAQSVEQVLKTPPPVCHLTGYGATRSNTCCGSGSRTPPPARPASAPP